MDKQLVYGIAREIAEHRPWPDASMEQFLMTPQSMAEQAMALRAEYHLEPGILMIGDDDHMSLLLAKVLGCTVDVFELDPRIVQSINVLAEKMGLRVLATEYDVRSPFPRPGTYASFYVNPPYSSKTNALGVKVWLTRALEGCIPTCRGVLVMPTVGHLAWTRKNVLSVQEFLGSNGCVVTGIGTDIHAYDDTHDPEILSTNFFIQRVDPTRSAPIEVSESTRIYR